MRRLSMLFLLLSWTSCAQKESGSSSSMTASTGSAASAGSGSTGSVGSASADSASAGSASAGSASASSAPAESPPPPPGSDGADEVAQLVVRDVGSKALGSQKIEASCVSVTVLPAGKWSVAAARLDGCGDKTARSILWLYKRADNGKWSEDYLGQPPRCWKGVPADIADAVTKATKIPRC